MITWPCRPPEHLHPVKPYRPSPAVIPSFAAPPRMRSSLPCTTACACRSSHPQLTLTCVAARLASLLAVVLLADVRQQLGVRRGHCLCNLIKPTPSRQPLHDHSDLQWEGTRVQGHCVSTGEQFRQCVGVRGWHCLCNLVKPTPSRQPLNYHSDLDQWGGMRPLHDRQPALERV